jgi:hypothetical protein
MHPSTAGKPRNTPHHPAARVLAALAALALTACMEGDRGATGTITATSAGTAQLRAAPKAITQIRVVGQPIIVFDHNRDQQEPSNLPDAQVSAWREADGTVDLMIPSTEAYRMRGPDLVHLVIDPKKIYSSSASGEFLSEDDYNFHHWLMGPYSQDGVHFYSISHSEWYACLLEANCAATSADGNPAQIDSWANTVNDFASADGGATWQLNTVNANHTVAAAAYHWTGSVALSSQIYLYALNHSGIFQPSRLVQEGGYWYAVAFYIHRDFTQINPAAGQYQAPIDNTGYVIIRTSDFTKPDGWEAWSGGNTYTPIAQQNFQTFEPTLAGAPANAAPPQLVYDINAQAYLLVFTNFGGSNAVYYTSTPSMANPNWSPAAPILGTAQLVSDPGGPLDGGGGNYGPVVGFNDANYPSIIDPQSPGYNFEFTSGSPQLFFSTAPWLVGGVNTARDLYRVQLAVTYQ